jgi:tetratricopeptide (TPR) repeat protein
MKRLILLALLVSGFTMSAQTKSELQKHYEAFYKQMKTQSDVQGIINSLTHLNVLAPSQARKDTLAYIYMSEGKHLQALNTIGIDVNPSDSDMALQVKAISLKSINQPEHAIKHFNEMFKRNPNAAIAYELAELNIQLQKLTEANKHITYGIANTKEDMMQTFYETQQPYQVPLKAAFLYLKGLTTFNENKTVNIDAAVAFLDQAMALSPNFNLALISKNALLAQKAQPEKKD